MRELCNLLVGLDERFSTRAAAQAREHIAAAGFALDERAGASDAALAWIDETFGGSWSGEVFAGSSIVAARHGSMAAFVGYAPQGLRFHWLRRLAGEPGVGIFGPFGVAPEHRGSLLGPALLIAGLCALRALGFERALIPAVGEGPLARYYIRHTGAAIVERFRLYDESAPNVRTVVMASGSGTNFQAVADAVRERRLPLDILALVTNQPAAYAIERANRAEVPVRLVPWNRAGQTRGEYDTRLFDAVAREAPELVLLLGWMHLLDRRFIEAFPNLINVHPSYLPLDAARDDVGLSDGTFVPAFRGAHAVRDALRAGSPWTGVSVHGVTANTDRGPILIRKPLRVNGETESELGPRLHALEHDLVPRAILRWIYER